jgi:hypothetical protein
MCKLNAATTRCISHTQCGQRHLLPRRRRVALIKGGKSGEPAVVPGQGSESQLVEFASDGIEDLEMPHLVAAMFFQG